MIVIWNVCFQAKNFLTHVFLQPRPIRIAVPKGPSHTLTGDVGIRLPTLSATSQVVCQVLLDK